MLARISGSRSPRTCGDSRLASTDLELESMDPLECRPTIECRLLGVWGEQIYMQGIALLTGQFPKSHSGLDIGGTVFHTGGEILSMLHSREKQGMRSLFTATKAHYRPPSKTHSSFIEHLPGFAPLIDSIKATFLFL